MHPWLTLCQPSECVTCSEHSIMSICWSNKWMNEQILSPLPSWKSFRQKVKYSAQLVGFPGGSDSKESACNAGDSGSIPGSGKLPGWREWQPTPVLLLGESMDRGAWQATVHGVASVGYDLVTKPPPPWLRDWKESECANIHIITRKCSFISMGGDQEASYESRLTLKTPTYVLTVQEFLGSSLIFSAVMKYMEYINMQSIEFQKFVKISLL